MSPLTNLWRDCGVISLLGIGYGMANETLLLPFVVILGSIVALLVALQYSPVSQLYHLVALATQVIAFAVLLLTSSAAIAPLFAPLAGLLIFRSIHIQLPYTLPVITGILIVLVGVGYGASEQSDSALQALIFAIVGILAAVLWVQQPTTEAPTGVASPITTSGIRSATASHPSFEMPSVAPFAFDSNSTDRLDEVAQQLETIRTVINQQVNQSARQIHTVEQLGATLRVSQEQLQSARHLLQTIDSTVMDVMSTTTDGHTSVQDTQRQLQQALDTVETVGRSMAQLVGDLRRVSEIVTAVSDVATQSNFLALNAQIEAARAGELGRGFTIVAEEVRDLATQSRESTKTMKSILRSIHQASSQAVRITEASSTDIASYATNTTQLDQFVTAIEETINNTHRALVRVIGVIEQLQNQIEQLTSYNQQLNQQTMQSQASLLMADNLSQSVQAILKKR